MLIDALTRALRESEALSAVYSKLDAGSDAALGIASSARAFAVGGSFRRHAATYVGRRAWRRRRFELRALARVVRRRRNRAAFSRAKRLPLCAEASRRA